MYHLQKARDTPIQILDYQPKRPLILGFFKSKETQQATKLDQITLTTQNRAASARKTLTSFL